MRKSILLWITVIIVWMCPRNIFWNCSSLPCWYQSYLNLLLSLSHYFSTLPSFKSLIWVKITLLSSGADILFVQTCRLILSIVCCCVVFVCLFVWHPPFFFLSSLLQGFSPLTFPVYLKHIWHNFWNILHRLWCFADMLPSFFCYFFWSNVCSILTYSQ